jgi:hypothetical protein
MSRNDSLFARSALLPIVDNGEPAIARKVSVVMSLD